MIGPALAASDDLANLAYHAAEGDGTAPSGLDAFSLWAPLGGDIMRRVARSRYGVGFSTRGKGLLGQAAHRWAGTGGIPGFIGDRAWNRLESRAVRRFERRTVRAFTQAFRSEIGPSGLKVAWKRGLWAAARQAGGRGMAGAVLASKVGGALFTAGNVAFLAPLALDLGRMAGAGLAHLGADRSRLDFGSTLIDTEQAYTQRQAGLMAIHNSQLNTRSFFGREAQYFHR